MSRRSWIGPLLVVGCILLANGAYIIGYSDPDPLGPIGRVAVSQRVGALPGQRSIDPNNGFVTQAIGREAARQVAQGHVPGWNTFEGIGMPLLASPQSAASSPFTGLLLLPNGLFVETFVLEIVAGLATYFLARRLGVVLAAATFAGAAFGLNGTFAWLQNGAMLPVAFIPMAMLGIEIAFDRASRRRPGGWAILAIGIALMVHAGFIETVYIASLLMAMWTIWRFCTLQRGDRLAFTKKIAAGVAAAAMLSAPLLLPFVDYLRVAFVGGHNGTFATALLPMPALSPEVGLPYAHGPIFAFDNTQKILGVVWGNVGGYLTISLVFLGILGLFGRRLRGLRLTLSAWISICFAKTFGPLAIVKVVNFLPGMKAAAFYRYMNPSLELAVVALCALAIDDIARHHVRPWRVGIAFAGTSLLTWQNYVRSAAETRHVSKANGYLNVSVAWACGVVAIIGVLLVGAALLKRPRLTRSLATIAVGIAIVDTVVMFGLPTLSANRDIKTNTTSVVWLREHIGLQRYFTVSPINVNYGSYFRISLVQNNNVPLPELWTKWLVTHYKTKDPVDFPQGREVGAVLGRTDLLAELAVSFVVFPHSYLVPKGLRPLYHIVHRDKLADIYKLKMTKPYFDAGASSCTITPLSKTTLRAHCDAPSALLRREQYFPGWSATVNNNPTPIHLRNELFQGIDLPEGNSTIHFIYTPSYFPQGMLLFFAAVLWLAVSEASVRRELLKRLARRFVAFAAPTQDNAANDEPYDLSQASTTRLVAERPNASGP